MEIYNIYKRLLIKRKQDIKNSEILIKEIKKDFNEIKSSNNKYMNKIIQENSGYLLVNDFCLLRNPLLRNKLKLKLIKEKNIFNIKFRNYFISFLVIFKIIFIFVKYIFDSIDIVLIIIFNRLNFKKLKYIKHRNKIFIIYPEDEDNKNNFSRYDSGNNLRISLGKPFRGFKLIIRLTKILNKFNLQSRNIIAIENFITIENGINSVKKAFLFWYHYNSVLFSQISAFLISPSFKSLKVLEKKISVIHIALSGNIVRRLIITNALMDIKKNNPLLEIEFPIEGAYWEKCLISRKKYLNKKIVGNIYSIPKILDLRFYKLLDFYKKAGMKVKYKYNNEKNLDKLYSSSEYNIISSDLLNSLKTINNENQLLIILSGKKNIDKELIFDAFKIMKIKNFNFINIKPHPASDKSLLMIDKIKEVKKIKQSIQFIFGSIYSSYIHNISNHYDTNLFIKVDLKNNIDSYVDPKSLKKICYYSNIEDLNF